MTARVLIAALLLLSSLAEAVELQPTGNDDAAAINALYAAGNASVELVGRHYIFRSLVVVPAYGNLEGKGTFTTVAVKEYDGDMVKLGYGASLSRIYLDGTTKGRSGGAIRIDAPDYYQTIDHVVAISYAPILRFVGSAAGAGAQVRHLEGGSTGPCVWSIVGTETDLIPGNAVPSGNRVFRDLILGVPRGLDVRGMDNTIVDHLSGGIRLGEADGPRPHRVVVTNSRTGNGGGGAGGYAMEIWADNLIYGPGNALWDAGTVLYGNYNEIIGRNGPAAPFYDRGTDNSCLGCYFTFDTPPSPPPTCTPPSAPAATLTESPPTVQRGGSVTATWSGIASPTPMDWIGLYAVGSSELVYLSWVYVSCTHNPTAAAASGSCSVPIPSSLAPGTYELRLYPNNVYGPRLGTSGSFVVTP